MTTPNFLRGVYILTNLLDEWRFGDFWKSGVLPRGSGPELAKDWFDANIRDDPWTWFLNEASEHQQRIIINRVIIELLSRDMDLGNIGEMDDAND